MILNVKVIRRLYIVAVHPLLFELKFDHLRDPKTFGKDKNKSNTNKYCKHYLDKF